MEVLGACQAKLLSCSSSPTTAKANIQFAIAVGPAGPQLQARDRRLVGTQNTQAGTQNTVGTRHTFVGTTNTLLGTQNTIPGKKTPREPQTPFGELDTPNPSVRLPVCLSACLSACLPACLPGWLAGCKKYVYVMSCDVM